MLPREPCDGGSSFKYFFLVYMVVLWHNIYTFCPKYANNAFPNVKTWKTTKVEALVGLDFV
jgi:hypothetical protein